MARRAVGGGTARGSLRIPRALERYKERANRGYSLTDCNSMLVMEDQGIKDVLTHDEHFQQAGFQALLRS